ncbi:hypothetical protein ARMSODRAFT_1016797 [Armillaria solidipes]|uniref:Uncharacterized protein n=1 Tax=Armillaria solidipes TaxID=1076256 RepID=A0A2H3C6P9_9AGAR|nr:hypothetical protein ARMSODRAFT_1016797 [Armillaria solidipes]
MNVHIAKDGEAVRILGAFIGNEVDMAALWLSILDKMQEKFESWESTHPTIEGRQLLIQMYASGFTQFLTRAQGMLSSVLERTQKIVHNFAWDNQGPTPINRTIQSAPIDSGGMQILDIKICNQAIEVMQLKSYLQLGDDHPVAGYVKDAIINRYMQKGTPRAQAQANIFL